MIFTPFLLMASASVRVSVLGEGQLRFNAGHSVAFSNAVTLRPNSAGLLADTVGRPVLPEIRVAGPFTVSMNGTVKVSGATVGRLVLETKGGDIGFPGQGTMGVLQIEGSQGGGARAEGGSTAPAPVRQTPVASRQSGVVTISVRPRSEVAGDRVLFGDIAEISGDRELAARLRTLDFCETPGLATRLSISRWKLQASLRNSGIADSAVQINLPFDAVVMRKSQTIDAQTFLDAAIAKAKEEYGDVDIDVTGMGPAPLVAPVGELKITATSTHNVGKMSVTVRVQVDGRPIDKREIQLSAKLVRVQSGESVHILVSRNGATMETEGRAKTAGGVGETIQVVTQDGATLTATVVAAGQVEVEL